MAKAAGEREIIPDAVVGFPVVVRKVESHPGGGNPGVSSRSDTSVRFRPMRLRPNDGQAPRRERGRDRGDSPEYAGFLTVKAA